MSHCEAYAGRCGCSECGEPNGHHVNCRRAPWFKKIWRTTRPATFGAMRYGELDALKPEQAPALRHSAAR